MAKREAPIEYLKKYIPGPAAAGVLVYLHEYKVHLTITRERRSILGDYRHANGYLNHRISVNGNLNKYSFLITLVHEMAHLVTFVQYGNRVQAHGKEWKRLYALLLKDFLTKEIFPPDILAALKSSLHNLPATSCADEQLMRILKKYDGAENGLVMVEQISEGHHFKTPDGKEYVKGRRLRKRFQCTEVASGRLYLFSPIYEVKPVMQQ